MVKCSLSSLFVALPFFFMLFHSNLSSLSAPKYSICRPDQSSALLGFRKSLSIINFSLIHDYCISDFPSTESWKEGSDCCSWKGVSCDFSTGNVIKLDLTCGHLHGVLYSNSTLFHLHHLRELNLALNDFTGSEISSMFGHFNKLTHLNLSYSNFAGFVPSEISHLSNLVSLDLSSFIPAEIGMWLSFHQQSFHNIFQNLTKLERLSLECADLSTISPSSLLNLSSSTLTSLHLPITGLHGKFPKAILQFPNLEELDLSWNGPFTGRLPKSNWTSSITLLFLGNCGFITSIPEAISNLTRLTYLDLSENRQLPANPLNHYIPCNSIDGNLPSWIFNLTYLSFLDLSGRQLKGLLPFQICGMRNITELYLSGNSFSGRIPSCLFSLPSLMRLKLSDNKLTGPIEHFNKHSPLQIFQFANNDLYGSVPNFVFELVNLHYLQLSSNNLSGTVDPYMFSNFTLVDFSHNPNLSLDPPTSSKLKYKWNLEYFRFSSCNLTVFPEFLRKCVNLWTVDLSNNKIRSQITKEELDSWPRLKYLNLSHNLLTSVAQIPSRELLFLDMHSNLLQGPLEIPPHASEMIFFSVAHNNLTGEISPAICNMRSLRYLILGNNSFSGKMPGCLGNIKTLAVLDLSMNNFHGNILMMFSSNIHLMTINLNGNGFEGALPKSLATYSNLEVLDVGNNKLNDTFPIWLEALPKLQVLVLRSNSFYGVIEVCQTRIPFAKLRILDVAHNQFSGILRPNLFESFKSMMSENVRNQNKVEGAKYMGSSIYFQDAVVLTWKGIDRPFERILTILTALDLSSNQFEGGIPEAVAELNLLKVLNLSHNHLAGQIPSSIRNLTELEALDLSSNGLTGKVPMELTSLTALSILNLSSNKLNGPIPMGPQFNTFEKAFFIGNPELCGPPLSRKCNEDTALLPVHRHEGEEKDDTWRWFWKMVAMGYGSGVVIGLSIGYMVFSTGKPLWLAKMLDQNKARKVRRNR